MSPFRAGAGIRKLSKARRIAGAGRKRRLFRACVKLMIPSATVIDLQLAQTRGGRVPDVPIYDPTSPRSESPHRKRRRVTDSLLERNFLNGAKITERKRRERRRHLREVRSRQRR